MGAGPFSGLERQWNFAGHPPRPGAKAANGVRLYFLLVFA